VLDQAARAATNTFVQRRMGDVFLAWENEAFLAVNEFGPDQVEIVVPTVSILAEPSVALLDQNVDRRGTREAAAAYLQYLYSPEGQEIAARHYYRPIHPEYAAAADLARFAELERVGIDAFGGWREAQRRFFSNGGIFDQIFSAGR
jgi:sulfate transport system substrate-binding protein